MSTQRHDQDGHQLSNKAKSSIVSMLRYDLDLSLNVGAVDGEWEIKAFGRYDENDFEQGYMLAISTYECCMLVVLGFTPSENSLNVVAKMLGISRKDLTKERYFDSIAEISNIFCGAVKRDMGQVFAHIGMSTPNLLKQESFLAYEKLEKVFSAHIKATHIDGSVFFGSAYMMNNFELDFEIKPPDRDNDEVGELEFF
jgi:hypothetical protein